MNGRSAAKALALSFALLGTTCCTITQADTGQYRRMLAEGADARAGETIACSARDLLCARLVMMRGEACAQTANDFRLSAAVRQERGDCALADAGRLPDVMPADAPADDRDRAALLVFGAWRAAHDRGDPRATAAAMQEATNRLASMPGGKPYADTLGAHDAVFAVLTDGGATDKDCAALADAARQLPAAVTPGSQLADDVALLRKSIASAQAKRSCAR